MTTITEKLQNRIAELEETITRYHGIHAASADNPTKQARALASLKRFDAELRFMKAMREVDGWQDNDHFVQELHQINGNIWNLIDKLASGRVRNNAPSALVALATEIAAGA